MTERLKVSIIITNYNYDRFVGEAIDSALNQSYQNTEVIVVDDGSTDRSRETIEGYGVRIKTVLKSNGGHISALNEGFNRSQGEIILFLDSDDILYSSAVAKAVNLYTDEKIAKIHWPLEVIDENGRKTGRIYPNSNLPEGDFQKFVLQNGPTSCVSPPTSGNAWSRCFLESVMPIPEFKLIFGDASDAYLFGMAPFFGYIKRVKDPQGCYRGHGQNVYFNRSFIEKVQRGVQFYDIFYVYLEKYCFKLGLVGDKKSWLEKSWYHQLFKSVQEITNIIPKDSALILVDDGHWGMDNNFEGRRVIPFLEENGLYAGHPENDFKAIAEIERLRQNGAHYIIFVWSCFWWLDNYKEFNTYLCNTHKCILKNERLVIFELLEKSF